MVQAEMITATAHPSPEAMRTAEERSSEWTVVDPALVRGPVFRALLTCIALLAAAGSLVEVAKVGFGAACLYGLGQLFDRDRETTVPAYFNALLLLLPACLLAVVALAHRRRHGRRWHRHWALLAIGLAYMSVDEAAGIHELLNRPARALLHGAPDGSPAAGV